MSLVLIGSHSVRGQNSNTKNGRHRFIYCILLISKVLLFPMLLYLLYIQKNQSSPFYVALCTKTVYFIRSQLVQQFYYLYRIRQIPVVQKKLHSVNMRILVEVVNPRRGKRASPANYTVHFVAFESNSSARYEPPDRSIPLIFGGCRKSSTSRKSRPSPSLRPAQDKSCRRAPLSDLKQSFHSALYYILRYALLDLFGLDPFSRASHEFHFVAMHLLQKDRAASDHPHRSNRL